MTLLACPDYDKLRPKDDAQDAGCDGALCVDLADGASADGSTSDGGGGTGDGGGVDAGCGPGQIQTPDAACVGSCAGKTCGPHTRCGSDGVTCECVTGYTKNGSGDCAWTGGPRDPELMASPPVWTIPDDAGVTYTPDASGGGLVDPGQVSFSNTCRQGQISQTFTMPTIGEAEPLALDLNASNPSYKKPNPPFDYTALYSLGGYRAPLPVTQPFARTRTCLGELAFGGPVTLKLFRECGTVVLDHAGIVAEPACPAPGKVANGDFEGTEPPTAWSALGGASVATDGPSVRGILTSANACDNPTIRGGAASVTRAGGQALVFRLEGPNKPPLRVGLGTTSTGAPFIGEVSGTNAVTDARVCVPAWARGMAWPIVFSIPKVGDCATARTGTLKVDDVRLEDDPACAGNGMVFGGDFEPIAGGARYGYVEETNAPLPISTVSGNNHVLSFTVHGYPSGVTETAVLAVSLPDAPHMALKFHYTAGGYGYGARSWSFEIPGGGGALDEGTFDKVQCIAAVPGGGPALLKFKAYSPDNYNDTALTVDDVRFEVDAAACP